jgi:trans-aconitate methyltransferase
MRSEQFQLHAALEDSHWWFVGRRRIMRDLVRQVLPGSDRPTVVDVGCGTGANVAALAEDYDCVGIDTSPEAIELAGRRFPGRRFICGRAPGDLGGVMGKARLVLLMDVLEHVPDDFAFLSELMAASAPGTAFLVTVPANPSFWSTHDESNGHYRRYDVGRFERLWAGLPVTTLLLSHYNALLYPAANVVRSWSRWRGRATGRAGTDVSLPIRPVNNALRSIFAAESRVLVDLLRRRRPRGYPSGLSLIALLRRDPGWIEVTARPDDVGPDLYDPATGRRHFESRHRPKRDPWGGTRDVAGRHRGPVL